MNRVFTLLGLLLMVLGTTTLTAQRNCATMDYLQISLEEEPARVQAMQEIEEFTRRYMDDNQPQLRSSAVVTIPVVVHVVWKTTSQNLSDAQILSQIQVLNEDFRRTNADADNTWSQASDAMIEFCLADTDPSGNPTSGITRYKTKKNQFSYSLNDVKFRSSRGTDAWSTSNYLNIWVCNLGSGLLGYAQFPGSGAASTDGVVIDYAYFGRGGTASAPFDLGRTATHEVGHWLNLRHIWGDGGCSVDDGVSDTPLSDAPNYGCAVGHVSCSSTDMVQNYMDYTDDACMNLYTSGQATRMNAVLMPGGFRNSLLSSAGCGGGTGGTCDVPGGLNASGITGSEAVLNWSAVSGALSYNVRARQTGTTTWSTGTTSGTSINFTGLTACTDYEFQIEAVCSGSLSGYSASSDFTTTGCSGGTCDAPTGLAVSGVSKKKATVSWASASGAVSYNIRYRIAGSSSWSNKSTASTSTNLTGLSTGSTYEWEVQSVCSSSSSGYVAGANFTAGTSVRLDQPALALYPNPAGDIVMISINLEEANAISIFDATGRQIREFSVDFSDQQTLSLNTSDLTSGLYFVRVQTTGGVVHTTRLSIRH